MKLTVSSSPHLHGKTTTGHIMRDVLIALVPCVLAGVFLYGFRSLLVVSVCTLLCILLEFICRIIMKRPQTVFDLSAAVTGVLLGLTLPPDTPILLLPVGCITAIVIVKQMFGGLGNNFVNPALTARIVMLVSFPTEMTTFRDSIHQATDAVTSATPLAESFTGEVGYLDLFLGNIGGSIGETCKLAILLGLVYLLLRRVISPLIPVVYVGTAALLAWVLGQDVLFTVLSGGLLFGAVFMATDYVTSPVTRLGKIIYAVGCGIITVLIRFYANLPEGVSYAIVLMNITVPLIERFTRRAPFGKRKPEKKKEGGV